MKLLKLFLILWLLFPVFPPKKRFYPNIPKDMWKLTQEFEDKIGIDMSNAEVVMAYLLQFNIEGLCDPETKTVYIDIISWSSLSEAQKEILLFHEYGHCHLNLRHIALMSDPLNYTDPKDCPMTIMYPTTFHDDCWVKNRESYIQTLKFHYETAIKETQFLKGE